ncbi:TetR/AcrR family transcriptional regulator [Paraburkholderia mimosarum]|uniref:TetR/AcrR family transcriptional regulator n=1 Tax=Paraburkholderia mimosarum TaxID=312026 RepID=UPI001EE2F0C2|nr:TetR/AcrR family transcriptional regulator [Paraburkholderia mimosarum]
MPGSNDDHRPRVAAERRRRMRMRLLESAMIVFAQKGVGASVIADVVAAAEVSKGSFYNYFRTNEELFQALAAELSRDIVKMIEAAISNIEDDPSLKVATAFRCYLHLIRSHALVAQFVAGAGLQLVNRDSGLYDYLPRHLRAGQKRGQFNGGAVGTMIDVVTGAGLMAVHRMVAGGTSRRYPEQVVGLVMCALGVTPQDAARLMAFPLPQLSVPPDSLLARAKGSALARDPLQRGPDRTAE